MSIESSPVILRALGSNDWHALRDLRLHALGTEPGVFFRHIDDERAVADDTWIALATGDDAHQVFGLFDGDRLVGIGGVFTERSDPRAETANFGMSYILPAYRGRRLASRIYEARLAWARRQKRFVRVEVGHRGSNVASRRSIERFGFRYVDRAPHSWPDGTEEDHFRYELLLDNDPARIARDN